MLGSDGLPPPEGGRILGALGPPGFNEGGPSLGVPGSVGSGRGVGP
jgi:hypothetical protein